MVDNRNSLFSPRQHVWDSNTILLNSYWTPFACRGWKHSVSQLRIEKPGVLRGKGLASWRAVIAVAGAVRADHLHQTQLCSLACQGELRQRHLVANRGQGIASLPPSFTPIRQAAGERRGLDGREDMRKHKADFLLRLLRGRCLQKMMIRIRRGSFCLDFRKFFLLHPPQKARTCQSINKFICYSKNKTVWEV